MSAIVRCDTVRPPGQKHPLLLLVPGAGRAQPTCISSGAECRGEQADREPKPGARQAPGGFRGGGRSPPANGAGPLLLLGRGLGQRRGRGPEGVAWKGL